MPSFLRILLAVLAVAIATARVSALSIPEPNTTFFGRVYNLDSGHEEILKSGTLVWTFSGGNAPITLNAVIETFNGVGRYRLDVPHSLLASGLVLAPGSLPLGTSETTIRHLGITVDGLPAAIRAPGRSVLNVNALRRGSAMRLDLVINRPFLDSDGDGMPDWWEDQFGLNKLVSDSNLDLDQDGVSNLAEFQLFTRPDVANSVPQLVAGDLTAMADGTSAVVLETLDADTAPAQLTYTLTSAPPSPGLILRRPGQPDAPLSAGNSFTQADVNSGRVVFSHPLNAAPDPVPLALSVVDATPGNPPSVGTVTLRFFRPELTGDVADLAVLAAKGENIPGVMASDQLRTRVYLLARERGHIAWDLSLRSTSSALSSFSPAAFLGGNGVDTLTGSLGDDVIAGGPADDILRGGAGRDQFLITSQSDGNDTLKDFSFEQGDAIRIENTLTGTNKDLRRYVRVASDSDGATLQLDFDGEGDTFNDMQIRIDGLLGPDADLFALVHTGRLQIPGFDLVPAVSVLAANPTTTENGPPPGTFVISRLGPTTHELRIPVLLSGSATNGVDYEMVAPQIIIPVGKESVTVQITALADSLVETTEVAQIFLQPDPAYAIIGSGTAQVTIGDLMPEITLEVLEPVAVLDSDSPAVIAVHRSGIVDRSLLVRFEIGGSASAGLDYVRLASFVNLAANQTSSILTIDPQTAAVLKRGVETVRIAIVENPTSYRIGAQGRAVVRIVSSENWAETWKAKFFANDSSSMTQFLMKDPGRHGLPNLLRYAFQLDPDQPVGPNLPKVRRSGGHLEIDFVCDHGARDLRYIVEFSTDMKTWKSNSASVEDVTPEAAEDARWSTWRAKRSVTQDKSQYLRVRVERIN